MTRATGQLCLAIVSVLLAGSAADGQTKPTSATALDPAEARRKIEDFLRQNCAACHGSNNPVVPQFDVTRFDSLARKGYLVPGQPGAARGFEPVRQYAPPRDGRTRLDRIA